MARSSEEIKSPIKELHEKNVTEPKTLSHPRETSRRKSGKNSNTNCSRCKRKHQFRNAGSVSFKDAGNESFKDAGNESFKDAGNESFRCSLCNRK